MDRLGFILNLLSNVSSKEPNFDIGIEAVVEEGGGGGLTLRRVYLPNCKKLVTTIGQLSREKQHAFPRFYKLAITLSRSSDLLATNVVSKRI